MWTHCLTVDTTSVFSKIACLLLTVAFTLFFCGYVSTGWIHGTEKRDLKENITHLNIGLWQTCFKDYGENRICQPTNEFLLEDWNEAWLPGSQGIFSTAFVFGLGSVAVCWSYILLPGYQEGPLLVFVAACSSFASCSLLTLGVLIIGIQQSSDTVNFYDTKLDWAFGMTVAATGITAVGCFLLTGDFYDILLNLAKKKQLNRHHHILKALDEAAVHTHNSNGTSIRNQNRTLQNDQDRISSEYGMESDTNSLDSSSPLYKNNTSRSPQADQNLPKTTGVINHTYDTCGDISGEESDVTCVRVLKQTGHLYDNNVGQMINNTASTIVNDSSNKPSTSYTPPLYDNNVIVKLKVFSRQDLIDRTSLDSDEYDKDPSQTHNKHVSHLFDVAKVKENKAKKTQTTPVNLFRASQDLNVFQDHEIPRYSTQLPSLGNGNRARVNYDTSQPKTSWHYNDHNQLVKSTPTGLFLTSSSRNEDFKRFKTDIKRNSLHSSETLSSTGKNDLNDEKMNDYHPKNGKKHSQDLTAKEENSEKERDVQTSNQRLLPLRGTSKSKSLANGQEVKEPLDSRKSSDKTETSSHDYKAEHIYGEIKFKNEDKINDQPKQRRKKKRFHKQNNVDLKTLSTSDMIDNRHGKSTEREIESMSCNNSRSQGNHQAKSLTESLEKKDPLHSTGIHRNKPKENLDKQDNSHEFSQRPYVEHIYEELV